MNKKNDKPTNQTVTLKNVQNLAEVTLTSYTKYAKDSPEPNDGSFIEKIPGDTFSSEGTVRYGEEQDADDL